MDPKNSMWTEKYRPKRVAEVVGDSKNLIMKYLETPQSMQHLLLYSITPGVGKTTIAKAIINELGADYLFLNSSKDRKIETVRDKISNFVQTKSSKDGLRRVVFLDEADGLTAAAQDSLRELMESYSSNALFILTCNVKSKIIKPIQSRCVSVQFSTPDKTEIREYLRKIAEAEQLEYTSEGLDKLIETNYPSIRDCVQVMQRLKVEGKTLKAHENLNSDEEFQALWKSISDKDRKAVQSYVMTNEVDIRSLNKFFWAKAVETDNVRMIQITASNEHKFTQGGEEIVIFVTSLIEMVK